MDEQEIAHRILDYLEELGSTLSDLTPDAVRIAMQAVYADAAGYIVSIVLCILIGAVAVYAGKLIVDAGKRDYSDEFITGIGYICMVTSFILAVTISGDYLIKLLQILIAPEYMALRKMVSIFTGADN